VDLGINGNLAIHGAIRSMQRLHFLNHGCWRWWPVSFSPLDFHTACLM